MPEEKKNVYLTIHKSFVREGIPYVDRATGEDRTFNKVILPKGTTIDGQDVSYFEFSPLFVNPSKYKGENFRDIPLLSHKEVWLRKDALDAEGNPVIGEDGRPVTEILKVMPSDLKEAVDSGRRQYLESLGDRAKGAREAADALDRNSASRSAMARDSIAI